MRLSPHQGSCGANEGGGRGGGGVSTPTVSAAGRCRHPFVTVCSENPVHPADPALQHVAHVVVVVQLLPELNVSVCVDAHAGHTIRAVELLGLAVGVAAVVDVARTPTPHRRVRHLSLVDPAAAARQHSKYMRGAEDSTLMFVQLYHRQTVRRQNSCGLATSITQCVQHPGVACCCYCLREEV